MIIRVLGSGTTLPDPERGPAGFLIEHSGVQILLDGGSGTLGRLARAGVDPLALAGGVYSHRHLDHTADLAPLLFTFRVARREVDYPIWAGEGFAAFLDGLKDAYGGWLGGPNCQPVVHELPVTGQGEAALPGDLRLITRPANHTAEALHLRFETPDGSSAVFSGDTGPSEALVELATGADLLVCECALASESSEVPHLWPEAIADIAARARPKRVVLTHLYPDVEEEEALRVVGSAGVEVVRARDLQAFSLDR